MRGGRPPLDSGNQLIIAWPLWQKHGHFDWEMPLWVVMAFAVRMGRTFLKTHFHRSRVTQAPRGG